MQPAAVRAAVPAGPVSSAVPEDITATPDGAAIAAAANGRFAGAWPGTRLPLEVWRDAGGILVAPQGTLFTRSTVVDARGRPGIVLVPLTPRATLPGRPDVRRQGAVSAVALGPAWRWVAQACFSRSSDVWSWLDHCYQLYGATGSDGWDYWELLRYGTAGANVPWALHGAAIGSYPTAASAPQAWVQWDPLGDQTGPCQPMTVQVTSPVAGISWPVNRCDTWTISKGPAGGTYQLTWSGPGTHGERGVAYILAVRVPHGAFAQWALPGGSSGSPF